MAERMKQRGSSEDLFPPSRQVIDQLQVTESVWTDPAVVAAIDATIAVYPPPDLVSESDGAKDEQGGGRDTEPDPTI